MFSSIQIIEILDNVIGDFFIGLCTIPDFILQEQYSIPSPSVDGRCMEEFSVCIISSQPINSGLYLPKVPFTVEEGVTLMKEVSFQIVKESIMAVVIEFLYAI